ncbi:hypothetical protein ElyMa_001744000 [Elysia marginata]|uniref:Uncharacterized protein n=1 Tax=Elysia marginata TaxID=1093978 RepID=A0AAV4E9S0_9GAST|nr:hypothetical protein ElyMa_001744000 [Elysia marginata]
MKTHLHRIVSKHPDPLQFAYKTNRSVEDAILHVLNNSYAHLDKRKASSFCPSLSTKMLPVVAETRAEVGMLNETLGDYDFFELKLYDIHGYAKGRTVTRSRMFGVVKSGIGIFACKYFTVGN